MEERGVRGAGEELAEVEEASVVGRVNGKGILRTCARVAGFGQRCLRRWLEH